MSKVDFSFAIIFILLTWVVADIERCIGRDYGIYSYLVLASACGIYYFRTALKRQFYAPDLLSYGCFFAIAIGTPTLLETDHFRYIWDGILSAKGYNPYHFAPNEFEIYYKKWWWASKINHSDLHTIYPPFAQVLFKLSSYLNPFFWKDLLNLDIFVAGPQTEFQLLLGWKFMVGLWTCGTIYFFRKQRWDLVVCNPLFLIQFLSNGHIDGVLVLLVGILIAIASSHELKTLAVLALALLTKLFPLIYLPFVLMELSTIKKLSIFSVFLFLIMVLSPFGYYFYGSDGHLFSSLIVFTKRWYFFGFIHRIFAALFNFIVPDYEAIFFAKIICALLGAMLFFLMAFSLKRRKLEFTEVLLFITIGFWALSPTIHPWYLLSLLPLAISSKPIYLTGLVWPFLALFSIISYLPQINITLIRYFIYVLVTVFLFKDLKKFQDKIRNRSASNDLAKI